MTPALQIFQKMIKAQFIAIMRRIRNERRQNENIQTVFLVTSVYERMIL